jgi:hypothetical protein
MKHPEVINGYWSLLTILPGGVTPFPPQTPLLKQLPKYWRNEYSVTLEFQRSYILTKVVNSKANCSSNYVHCGDVKNLKPLPIVLRLMGSVSV